MKKYNLKNIILIASFLVIITAPNLYFLTSSSNDSAENRTLASFPELSIKNIENFPQEFETFYNDNLPYKSSLTKLNSLVHYTLLNTSPKNFVIKGSDDWLFYDSKYRENYSTDSIADYQGTNHYTSAQLEYIKNNVLRIRDIVESNGAEFILMFGVNKETIEYEHLPSHFKQINTYSKLDELVDYLTENTDLTIVYPKADLLAYKDQFDLYYKLDTHWNGYGNYIAFKNFMQVVYDDTLPNVEDINFEHSDKNYGDLSNLINMGGSILSDDIYTINNMYKYQVKANSENSSQYGEFTSSNPNGVKALAFCDSFLANGMTPYFSQLYSNFEYYAQGFNEEIFLNEQPDILIYQMVERNTGRLFN